MLDFDPLVMKSFTKAPGRTNHPSLGRDFTGTKQASTSMRTVHGRSSLGHSRGASIWPLSRIHIDPIATSLERLAEDNCTCVEGYEERSGPALPDVLPYAN